MKCPQCDKVFKREYHLRRHQSTAHNVDQKSFSCAICSKVFNRADNLKRHVQQAHTDTPARCDQCDEEFPSARDLKTHVKQHHAPRFPAPSRQTTLVPDSLPDEDPLVYDGDDEILRRHWNHIRTNYKRGHPFQDQFNFRLDAPSEPLMKKLIRGVYDVQRHRSKWNLAFGFVLRESVTGDERFFYSSNNTTFFDMPKVVKGRLDLEALVKELEGRDVLEWARQQRPNSKFVVERITNMTVIVTKLQSHMLIGRPPTTPPDYIINSRSMNALFKDKYGRRYRDDKCFFRCLTLKMGHRLWNHVQFEEQVDVLCRSWCEAQEIEDFRGVTLDDLDQLEVHFNVRIVVYELEFVEAAETELQRLEREADEMVPEFQPVLLQDLQDDNGDELMPSEDEEEEEAERPRGGGAAFLDDMADDDAEADDGDIQNGDERASVDNDDAGGVNDDALSSDDERASVDGNERIGERMDDGPVAALVRGSSAPYETTVNLNLYQGHFSYITNLETYAKSWQCEQCGRPFKRHWDYNRHMRICQGGGTELRYKGGGFGLKKTIHQELREEDVPIPRDIYEFLVTFDFEARFERIEQDEAATRKLVFTQKLIPASVSIASNVPGYEDPVCFIDEPEDLIARMDAYLSEVSDKAYDLMREDFAEAVQRLDFEVARNKECERDYSRVLREFKRGEAREAALREAKGRAYESRRWVRYQARLQDWLRQLVVLGFNSAKFDLNLIKQYYIPHLVRNGEKVRHAIMKNNSFLSLATDSLVFLDIANYLSPGTSYDKFLRAFKVEQTKGFWPYEWFRTLDQLDQDRLPPIEEFYSTLKQRDFPREDYEYLQGVWRDEGFTTMRDLLVWYNNRDVGPFLVAVGKMFAQFKEWGIDMFKQAMTLPGVAMRRMMHKLPKGGMFTVFSDKWKDLHHLIKDNIVGGPAIVFTRHHEVGATKIRGTGNDVGKIVGYDANSLYLWALCQEMPSGFFSVWRPERGELGEAVATESQGGDALTEASAEMAKMKKNYDIRLLPIRSYTHGVTEQKFIEYQRRQLAVRFERPDFQVQHLFNGGQKVFYDGATRYYVDGYVAKGAFGNDRAIVIEFDGCYWHCSHRCDLNKNTPGELFLKRSAETRRKHEFLETLGCEVIIGRECDFEYYWATREDHEWDEWSRVMGQTGFRDLGNVRVRDLVTAIRDDKVFGVAEVDIQVPYWTPAQRDMWAEMPPVFKNVEVTREDLGAHMQQFAEDEGHMPTPRRALIGSYFGEKILLATPLLRFYIKECGMKITRVYQFVEYGRVAAFEHLGEEVAEQRRRADRDPNEAIKGELFKLIGNNYYGRLLLDMLRFEEVSFVVSGDVPKYVADPRFKKMSEVVDGVFEVHMAKKKITFDLPHIIPYFVYQYAKLRMLQFYRFLVRTVGKENFEMVQMDTDSLYFAVSRENLEDMVPEERRDVFNTLKESFIAYDDHSKRTPGLFKLEWSGDGMVALNSKTYYGWTVDGGKKVSTKGLSKATNNVTEGMFKAVLGTKRKAGGTNHGFRLMDSTMVQYRQDRDSLSYFYPKRRVLDDGVSTMPLNI